MKDYYGILGVDRDAGQDEIKKRFRQLARETHPDANPNDAAAEARFREIAEAYEVLSDPQRRASYDRGEQFDPSNLFSSFAGIEDLLNTFFGGGIFSQGGRGGFGNMGGRRSSGPDVGAAVELTLEEAATGVQREVSFTAPVHCSVCEGTGAEPGSSAVRCPQCGGSGSVRVSRRTLLGQMTTVGPCDRCRGAGQVIEHPCPHCLGAAVEQAERTVTLDVPAGIGDATRLRLSGRGGSGGAGLPAGDLYVDVRVLPDPRFRRDGDDLYHGAVIGISEASLGTTYAVPHIDGGDSELDIPAGTQPGTVFQMPRRGMPRLQRRGRGDLYVVVEVQVPSTLTPEQRAALESYADLAGESPHRKRRRLRKS